MLSAEAFEQTCRNSPSGGLGEFDRRGFPLQNNKDEKAFQVKNTQTKTSAPPSFLYKKNKRYKPLQFWNEKAVKNKS